MTNLVTLNNGRATTTSLLIAETFEKKHYNVLQSIENLKPNLPVDFWKLNFQFSNYETKSGKNTVMQNSMYILTRDAFTLLAMGFTGKKAMQFKLAYIEAFNKMEAELKRQQEQKALPETSSALSTAKDRQPIFNLVRQWAKQKGIFHKDCWKMIHKEFSLHSISELPKNKIQDVCNFICDQLGIEHITIDQPAIEEQAPQEQSLPVPAKPTKPELTFLPVPQKLPTLMFDYEPNDFAAFHARQMLERYGYKQYAYNAYMLSCKACELFNDFEQKIQELMKDYDKIAKPVYSAMYAKVTDNDSEVLQDGRLNTREELDRHGACVNFTSTMWQTLDKTYSKFMHSRSDYLRNEVDQMIQTLRHTAKVLDM